MRRSRPLLALLATIALAAPAAPAQEAFSDACRKALQSMDALQEHGEIVVHFDPDVLNEKQVAGAVKRNKGFYAEVERALGLKPPYPVHVFLYRDAKQMHEITGRDAASAAFSIFHSVHAPFEYDDCHEFVHVFAQHLPTDEQSVAPTGFFVEGLATAIQAEDRGVPMSTWAAVYARYGRAPSLVDLLRSWPEGVAPGVHPYHLTGSFHDYLIQQHGMEKVKRYYTHSLEAHEAFGKGFVALESDWRTWLDDREIPAEHEKLVLAAMGIDASLLLPKTLREAKGTALFDGESLKGWKPAQDGVWSVRDGLLVGSTDQAWVHLATAKPRKGVLGLRVRFRVTAGDAFQLRTHGTDAGANEAICAAWRTFLLRDKGRVVAASDWKFVRGAWHEAVFTTADGVSRLWIDGVRVAATTEAGPTPNGVVALAIEKADVEIASVEALSPK